MFTTMKSYYRQWLGCIATLSIGFFAPVYPTAQRAHAIPFIKVEVPLGCEPVWNQRDCSFANTFRTQGACPQLYRAFVQELERIKVRVAADLDRQRAQSLKSLLRKDIVNLNLLSNAASALATKQEGGVWPEDVTTSSAFYSFVDGKREIESARLMKFMWSLDDQTGFRFASSWYGSANSYRCEGEGKVLLSLDHLTSPFFEAVKWLEANYETYSCTKAP